MCFHLVTFVNTTFNVSYIKAGSIKPNQTYAVSSMADKFWVLLFDRKCD